MPDDYEVGPLYLDILDKAQWITEKAFTTRFTDIDGDSWVDFGPYREEEMSSIDEYVEIPVDRGFFYSAKPLGVKFGATDSGEQYALDGSPAVFTTGVSLSFVPSGISAPFFKRLIAGTDAYDDNGIFYINCGTIPKDMWLMFQGHWIQIRGKDMVTDISELKDNTLCIINFIPSIDNFWVLGNTIFKDYYVHHDPVKGAMGFVPTNQRFKSALVPDAVPQASIEFGYDSAFMYLKLTVFFVLVGAYAATAIFVFTSSFKGLSFLNKSSNQSSNVSQKKSLAKKFDQMSTAKLEELLAAVQAKKAASADADAYNLNIIQ